jgi:hypothetical protein
VDPEYGMRTVTIETGGDPGNPEQERFAMIGRMVLFQLLDVATAA